MNDNLFTKLNNALIIAILQNLSARDFLHCIATCKLLYKYKDNNGLLRNLCQTRLIEIMPLGMRLMLDTMILPKNQYGIDPSRLFHTITYKKFSMKWLLLCLMVEVKPLARSKNGFVNGHILNGNKLYVGEFKPDKSYLLTLVEGISIDYIIRYGFFDNSMNCTGFRISNEYVGQNVKGYKHGKGVQLSNYGIYDGDLKKNKKNGYGEFAWNNGSIYKGKWVNNARHGYGIHISMDIPNEINIYDGEWINDKHHGEGKFVWNGNNIYDGEWTNGNMDGYGVYTTSDGIKYDGAWINDKCHGLGTIYHRDGLFWTGRWIDGIPTNNNALHTDMQLVIRNNQCTKILADIKGKYCQILYEYVDNSQIKMFCQICLDTCYLSDMSKVKQKWTVGNNICNCPCKIIEKDNH